MRRALLLAVVLGACAGTEIRFDPSPSCSYRTVPSSRDVGAGTGQERRATDIAAGERHTCARLDHGDDVLCWGANDLHQISYTFDRPPLEGLVFDEWRDAFDLGAGGAHACVRSNDGIECWGNNAAGQLGVGHSDASPGARPAEGTEGAVTLAVGLLHACAVLEDGSRAVCWGDNRFGQLGVEDAADCCPLATDVEGLPAGLILQVAAGAGHTCAIVEIAELRELWCWGDDRFGQLGDGEAGGSRATPARVTLADEDPLGIVAGAHHTCLGHAPLDGSAPLRVSCWGRGDRGELGDGRGESRAMPGDPVLLPDLRPIRGDASAELGLSPDETTGELVLADHAGHTCALLEDGSVWCWGANDRGQLGDGTTEDALVPVRAQLDTRAVDLSTGGATTCAADEEGVAWCWGANDHGQLGVEPGEDALVPVRATVVP